MSPRRASLPPPLPPLRARPDTTLAIARDVPVRTLAAPSRSRRGHKNNKLTIKTFNTCATIFPTPAPAPARACPFTPHRFRSGRARSDCSLPPPAPGGGYNYIIHTFQHNYCVSALPHPATDFFSFARSFTWSHPSLRFGMCPGERPRKGFPAPHTIKAIVNKA